MKITLTLSILILSTVASLASAANTPCAKEIAAIVPGAADIERVYIGKNEVALALYGARLAPKSERDYYSALSQQRPLIAVEARFDSDNSGGSVWLTFLDGKTCKSLGKMTISEWND